jgi:protoheme ferro-lyase
MAWLGIAFLSLVGGYEAVRFLIAPPASMTGHAAFALCCLFLSLTLLVRLKKISRRLAGLGLLLLCGIAGYFIACGVYLKASEHEGKPAISFSRAVSAGHTAIIYFTHGEPRTYEGSFEAWKHAIHEMDETGVPFVPWPFRPFFFKKVRDEYFEVGGSFHNHIHARTMERIESAYRKKSDPNARCYIAFSDDEPNTDVVAARAINEGASRIILLNVWLTDSDHSEQGLKKIQALHPEQLGIKLFVTDTLWQSHHLMRMIVERANKAAGDMNKADIGILLVAHGQPASWDAIFKKQPQQENSFRQETKKLLAAEGFMEGNIALAYMEFKQPDIRAAVHELLAVGVKKILVVPVNISAESIHSEHEIPSMVEQSDVPHSVTIMHLGAWNDDQRLIEALLEKLLACQ